MVLKFSIAGMVPESSFLIKVSLDDGHSKERLIKSKSKKTTFTSDSIKCLGNKSINKGQQG